MKTHILNYEPERRGGGWTAARYLYDGLEAVSYDEADTVLITGPTMASRDQVQQAKRDAKKIVLRADNMPRNSRNRNTGASRLKEFSDVADLVIYQSEWAKRFLYPFTKKDGPVVLNGCDTSVFNDKGRNAPDDSYLYVRSSRDEGKQWIMAWYWFVNNPGKLEIVGKFSRENMEYNFDFYNGEQFKFYGEQTDMAMFYKKNKYFLYSYTNDACSNTLIESKASGCEIIDVYNSLSTGGAPEIMACEDLSLERMIKEYEQQLSKLA